MKRHASLAGPKLRNAIAMVKLYAHLVFPLTDKLSPYFEAGLGLGTVNPQMSKTCSLPGTLSGEEEQTWKQKLGDGRVWQDSLGEELPGAGGHGHLCRGRACRDLHEDLRVT